MSWLTILWLVIKYGPAIYQLIRAIIDLINGVSNHMPQSEAEFFKVDRKAELENAIEYYRVTRDKSKLEAMHGELTVQLSNFETR